MAGRYLAFENLAGITAGTLLCTQGDTTEGHTCTLYYVVFGVAAEELVSFFLTGELLNDSASLSRQAVLG